MARSSECTEQYAQKTLDTADIVREAIFRELRGSASTAMRLRPSKRHSVALTTGSHYLAVVAYEANDALLKSTETITVH